MLHPLHSLFDRPEAIGWQEADVRYFVQEYLRRQLKTEALYCDSLNRHRAEVRVGTPALQQAVALLEADLKQVVQQETGYALRRIIVRSQW